MSKPNFKIYQKDTCICMMSDIANYLEKIGKDFPWDDLPLTKEQLQEAARFMWEWERKNVLGIMEEDVE